jgi:hypothetical protein
MSREDMVLMLECWSSRQRTSQTVYSKRSQGFMWTLYVNDIRIKALILDEPRIESNVVDVCHAYGINVLMMLRMDNVHWVAWGIRFCTIYIYIYIYIYIFWRTEMKKLSNSEITLDDFADSEYGAKFSVFQKLSVRL